MDNWIGKYIIELKGKYETCQREKEHALASYIFYMLRLLNGMSQMQFTGYLVYEKSMLWSSIRVFLKYFIEEIDCVLNDDYCGNIKIKKAIIDEIEEAVIYISETYKNLVDGTANADRQIFLSMTVDTNMYDISPKFCAFYSIILKKLAKMFDQEYAFLVNPTLEYNTKTKVLFQRKKSVGKVVVIMLSERTVEQIDVNSICIMHEAFHSLTREERLRRKRAICLQQIMLDGIWQLMYKDVSFHQCQDTDLRIKNSIVEYFFINLKKEKENYENLALDDRFFYGNNIEAYMNNLFTTNLLKMLQDNRRLQEIVLSNIDVTDYNIFSNEVKKYDEAIQKLRKNVLSIIANDAIEKLSMLFLEIFRETYADMGCVLTYELDPKFYEFAFSEVPQIRGVSDDEICLLRKMIVADVISRTKDESLASKWRGYRNELKEKFYANKENCNTNEQNNGQNLDNYGIIGYSKLMMDAFCDYLKECSQYFTTRLASIPELQEFRAILNKALEKDEALIANVLLGDTFVVED